MGTVTVGEPSCLWMLHPSAMMLARSRVGWCALGSPRRSMCGETRPLINAAWRDPETQRGGAYAKSLRAEKKVPGAVTGKFLLPGNSRFRSLLISLDTNQMKPHLRQAGFFQRVHDLRISNVPGIDEWGTEGHDGELRLTVLPREVHEHMWEPNHIQNFSFQVLGAVPIPENQAVEKIRLDLRVKVKNKEKSPGVKRGASIMEIFERVPVYWDCGRNPGVAPQTIEVDIEGCAAGETIKVSDSRVTLPPNTTLIAKPGEHKLDYGLVKISKKVGRD